MSEITTNFWIGMAILVGWLIALSVAAYAGSITGSTWVAAGAGAVVGIVHGCVLHVWREGDEEKKAKSLGGLMAALVGGAALASYAIYRIVASGPNELGFMDYENPVAGGWLIGIVIFAIWSDAKTRKSDVTQ